MENVKITSLSKEYGFILDKDGNVIRWQKNNKSFNIFKEYINESNLKNILPSNIFDYILDPRK